MTLGLGDRIYSFQYNIMSIESSDKTWKHVVCVCKR